MELNMEFRLEDYLKEEDISGLKKFNVYDLVKESLNDTGLIQLDVNDVVNQFYNGSIVGTEIFDFPNITSNFTDYADSAIVSFSGPDITLREMSQVIDKIRENVNNDKLEILYCSDNKQMKSYVIYFKKK